MLTLSDILTDLSIMGILLVLMLLYFSRGWAGFFRGLVLLVASAAVAALVAAIIKG